MNDIERLVDRVGRESHLLHINTGEQIAAAPF